MVPHDFGLQRKRILMSETTTPTSNLPQTHAKLPDLETSTDPVEDYFPLSEPSEAIWTWMARPTIWLLGVILVPVLCIVAVAMSWFWGQTFSFMAFMQYYGLGVVLSIGGLRIGAWLMNWRRAEWWSLLSATIGICLSLLALLVEDRGHILPLLAGLAVLVMTDSLSRFHRMIPAWVAALTVPILIYALVSALTVLGGLLLDSPIPS